MSILSVYYAFDISYLSCHFFIFCSLVCGHCWKLSGHRWLKYVWHCSYTLLLYLVELTYSGSCVRTISITRTGKYASRLVSKLEEEAFHHLKQLVSVILCLCQMVWLKLIFHTVLVSVLHCSFFLQCFINHGGAQVRIKAPPLAWIS